MYTKRKFRRVPAMILAILMLAMAIPFAALSVSAEVGSAEWLIDEGWVTVIEPNATYVGGEDLGWTPAYVGSYYGKSEPDQVWDTVETSETSGYRLSDTILVPEAYTTLTWTEFCDGSTISENAMVILSYKYDADLDDMVPDPSGFYALSNGSALKEAVTAEGVTKATLGLQTYDSANKTMTYTYTTTQPNEVLRIAAYGELDANGDGTGDSFYGDFAGPDLVASKAVFVEGDTAGEGTVEVEWKDGYVGSMTKPDASQYNQFVAGAPAYWYADVVIPKAGTTIYCEDEISGFTSHSAYAFSTWKMNVDHTWGLIAGIPGSGTTPMVSTNNSVGQSMLSADGSKVTYYYTSTYDNERVVLSMRVDSGSNPFPTITYEENSGKIPALKDAGYRADMDHLLVTDLGWRYGYVYTTSNSLVYQYDNAGTMTNYTERTGSNSCVFTYSDIMPIYGKGTKLTFIDGNLVSGGDFLADSVYAFAVYDDAAGTALNTTKSVKGGTYTANADGSRTYTYTTTADVEYVRVCNRVEKNVLPWNLLYKEVPGQIAYDENLEGLTMLAIGDSYLDVWTQKGVVSEGKTPNDMNGVWLNLLAQKYGMQHVNYGGSGNTIANYKDKDGIDVASCMINRYTKMKGFSDAAFAETVDLIVFEGGRNDYNHDIPLGDVNSYDVNTLSGAVNTMLDAFLETYPNAIVICVTAWSHEGHSYNGPNTAGNYCDDYARAFEAVVNARQSNRVKIIDAYNTAKYPVFVTRTDFTALYNMKAGDQSHLNVAGMKFVLPYFEATISQYYEQFLSSQVGEGETGIFFVNENGQAFSSMNTANAGTMSIPTYQPDPAKGYFVGWKGTLNGEESFIPGSGTLTFNAGDQAVYDTPVYLSVTASGDASVRFTSGSTGMRFTTNVPLADWEALSAVATLERGTLIVPEMYVDRIGGKLTHAALDAAEAQRLDVKATDWYTSDETTGTFAGSIANIKTKNHTLNFTAAGYVKVTYANGAVAYFYAKDATSNIRTIYTLAYEAMHDRKSAAEGDYTFEVSTGSYSKYNAYQIGVLKAFLAPVIALSGNATAGGATLTSSDIFQQEGLELNVVFAGENGFDGTSGEAIAGEISEDWYTYAMLLGDAANGATGIWVITKDGGFGSADAICGVALDGVVMDWAYYTDGVNDAVVVAFSTYSDFH